MTHPKTNEDILQALARGYCAEGNTHKVVDHQLVEAMATEIESWLRTLLAIKDAERDEAVKAARRKVHLAEFLPGHVYALPIEQITSTQAAQIGMMASCRIVLLPTECFNLALSPKDPLSTDQVTEK